MEPTEGIAIDPEDLEDTHEEIQEENLELSQDIQDAYGAPEPEPKFNPHIFLSKAAFESDDTLRTTFLTEEELGKPIFTVRFMLDLYKRAKHRNLLIIANYFEEKIQNVTHSGMSREGFAMNLNVTRKSDMTRTKVKGGNLENLQNQGNNRR